LFDFEDLTVSADIAVTRITKGRIELEPVDELQVVVENRGVVQAGSGIDPGCITRNIYAKIIS
jgi:hypothetical protein